MFDKETKALTRFVEHLVQIWISEMKVSTLGNTFKILAVDTLFKIPPLTVVIKENISEKVIFHKMLLAE